MDGSDHKRFEDRGPKCVLMAYRDDARGRVYARFYALRGNDPGDVKRYAKGNGLPLAVPMSPFWTVSRNWGFR